MAGNGPEFAVVLLGALAAGLVVAPASPLLTEHELARLLARVDATYVVADTSSQPAAKRAAAGGRARAVLPMNAVLAMASADGAAPLAPLVGAGPPLPPQPATRTRPRCCSPPAAPAGRPRAPPTPMSAP